MTTRHAPWTVLDLARPCYALRCAARGVAPVTDRRRAAALGIAPGTDAPVLTLPEAAALLGVAVSTAHQVERREQGLGVGAGEAGSVTLANLLARADAFGLDIEIRVRRR
jgi:hypothetical protein